jgi:hypothetical protein
LKCPNVFSFNKKERNNSGETKVGTETYEIISAIKQKIGSNSE